MRTTYENVTELNRQIALKEEEANTLRSRVVRLEEALLDARRQITDYENGVPTIDGSVILAQISAVLAEKE